ncbi:MAG: FAD-dependent oxidoreductase [Planctomycetaceae bacterium]|nr:FAD-dependent oxidoreductase [Planctomycetaceae bacterium]
MLRQCSRRHFLTTLSASGAVLLLPQGGRTTSAIEREVDDVALYDVAVIGGTPGGVAAAVAAARLGRTVVLVEEHAHLGGMSASGLGKSDIEHRELIQGLFGEFVRRVHQHYIETYGRESENVSLCRDGYYYEPSVAEAVFDRFVEEQPTLTVLRGHRLDSVVMQDNAAREVVVHDRATGAKRRLRSNMVIDATYEGDVYAAAGARFRLGRESRDAFGEPHAGVVYFDYQNQQFLEGTTGAASNQLPAYTYRLCLTTDPANAYRLAAPPPDYDRTRYLGYFDDLRAGRLAGPKNYKPGRGYHPAHFNTLVRALSVTEIPNRKTDVNMNPRPLGFPFAEENAGYVEGDWETRDRIAARIRNITLGLVWFLQHDPEVPPDHRAIASEYQFPRDEFVDNEHFPFQLYVREARRLAGLYTLTELDVTRTIERPNAGRFDDSIAVGEFPIDSFPVRKRQPQDSVVLEGYLGMLDYITRPYQIPYRIMIPESVDGLIVPVAASTSHVAYSSIRMEPTWMALGQAAGVAAHLALRDGVQPRDVSISALQTQLRSDGQVIDLPS